MMNRIELRKLSLEFRRISSNFLNSTDDTADVNLSRFVNFITENEILKNVMLIECREGVVTLTDIMGREEQLRGEIISADLTGGTVVVRPKN